MGEADLAARFDPPAAAHAPRRGGPFAHAIQRQDGGRLKRRGEERRRRVGLVMLGKQDLAVIPGVLLDGVLHPELLLEPLFIYENT